MGCVCGVWTALEEKVIHFGLYGKLGKKETAPDRGVVIQSMG
jgi:hypothetical protein